MKIESSNYFCMTICLPQVHVNNNNLCFAGVIVFGSDQEVGELMRAIDRANMSGHFVWIGSDGWGGRTLVSDGNEAQVYL